MVSKNVWVEATLTQDSAKALDLGWVGVQEPPDKMHITMAFTNMHVDDYTVSQLMEIRDDLSEAVSDLPALEEDEIKVNGVAFLAPGKSDYGVLLVQSQLLWSYNQRLSHFFTAQNALDLTYPGWLPHITISEGVSNYGDQEVLHKLAAKVDVIKLDGLWLRAGRMCVPL